MKIKLERYVLTNQQEIILGGIINSSLSTNANHWLFANPVPRDSFKEVFKKCNEVDLWLFNETLPQYTAQPGSRQETVV